MSLPQYIPNQHNLTADDASNDGTFEVTIRFSASLPDLPLSVPSSPTATTATLKQLIRAAIPDEYRTRRIRLIHAGKALFDDAVLRAALKIPSRPPSRAPTPAPYDYANSADATGKSKGKTPVREATSSQQSRIYVHCSIGDVVLTPAELSAEVLLAHRAFDKSGQQQQQQQQQQQNKQEDGTGNTVNDATDAATTTPAPRGFDRLLNAGFSTGEVQSLRLQFMAIQSHTHTPDTMPSPNTLRNLEDQWLDNGDAVGGQRPAGGSGMMADEDTQAGALDDMIWGAVMGFLWPIGCLMWGTREDGIWSQRRKMAVVVGVVLNIGVGFVRYTS